MGLLTEYGLDDTVSDWESVKKECDKLTREEVEDALSRRRKRGDPSDKWKMWQNGLKRRHNLLKAKSNEVPKIQEKFNEIKEEFEIYSYIELETQEWLIDNFDKLLQQIEEEV